MAKKTLVHKVPEDPVERHLVQYESASNEALMLLAISKILDQFHDIDSVGLRVVLRGRAIQLIEKAAPHESYRYAPFMQTPDHIQYRIYDDRDNNLATCDEEKYAKLLIRTLNKA